MNRLLFLLFALFSHFSFSCDEQPTIHSVHPDELISRTSQIVLAKVVSASISENGNEVNYKFETIKVLKGSPIESFEILGYPLFEEEITSFDHHNSEEFWTNYGGRVYGWTDCEIHPGFSVGLKYLVFMGKPYHVKSFEIIYHNKDKWLLYVEEKIKP